MWTVTFVLDTLSGSIKIKSVIIMAEIWMQFSSMKCKSFITFARPTGTWTRFIHAYDWVTMELWIGHWMGVAVHTMVQFIAVTDSMSITVIIFDLSTTITCAKKLAVYINNILKTVWKAVPGSLSPRWKQSWNEFYLGRPLSTSKDEMGMIGHAVASVAVIVLHNHLSIKFIFTIMNNVIIETNTF